MEREARSKTSKVVRGSSGVSLQGYAPEVEYGKLQSLVWRPFAIGTQALEFMDSWIHVRSRPGQISAPRIFGAAISKVVRFPPHLQTSHRASQKETSVPLLLVAGYRVDHQVLYYLAMTAAVGRALVSFHVCWARLPRMCFRGRSVGLDHGHAWMLVPVKRRQSTLLIRA